MTGKIRIISGQWRGRKLTVLDQPGLRPTSDRARETLFNWIGPRVAGSRCVDLFAGTGALGLEAASRGASQVTLIEKSRPLADQISGQIATWPGADCVQVVCGDALAWLASAGGPLDLVFIDPPYAQGLQRRALLKLIERQLLADQGLVYVEAAVGEDWAGQDAESIDARFEILRERAVGQINLNLLRYRAGQD